jgi:hypothetical protein
MKTKKNKSRIKKTRGGNPTVSLALICHGGNQITDENGDLNEFTVSKNVVINFFVPKNTTSFSVMETPIEICNNGMPIYESFVHGQLCPNYDLKTIKGEIGGIYECHNISFKRIKHKYVIHKGIQLSRLVNKLTDRYLRKTIILNCYFCRANEETANEETIAREDPLMSIRIAEIGDDELYSHKRSRQDDSWNDSEVDPKRGRQDSDLDFSDFNFDF